MKYMLLFVDDQEVFNTMAPDTRGQMFQRIGEWWEKHSSEGRIVGGAQLQPPGTATTVRLPYDGGRPVITDGPFLEAKEGIGGFALVEVANLDEALELARTWPARGRVEVRPLVEDPGEESHEH